MSTCVTVEGGIWWSKTWGRFQTTENWEQEIFRTLRREESRAAQTEADGWQHLTSTQLLQGKGSFTSSVLPSGNYIISLITGRVLQ